MLSSVARSLNVMVNFDPTEWLSAIGRHLGLSWFYPGLDHLKYFWCDSLKIGEPKIYGVQIARCVSVSLFFFYLQDP